MAIVKMKRVTVVASDEVKENLLKELMWLSSVDITPLAEKLSDPGWSALLERVGESDKVFDYSQKIDNLNQTMVLLVGYSTIKKSLFTPRIQLTRKDFEAFEKDDMGVFQITDKALDIKREAILVKNQQNKLLTQKQSLLPWQEYPISLDDELTTNTKIIIGILPNIIDFEKATDVISDSVSTAYMEKLSADSEQQYIAVICHKDEEQALNSVLAGLHFSAISFKGMKGTVSVNIEKINDELSSLDKQSEEQIDVLKKLSEKLPDIERAYDILNNIIKLHTIRECLLKTQSAFMIDGWLPEKKLPELTSLLDSCECYYELSDPLPEDEPPILLHNSSLVHPFEAITEMYALPTYRGLDPDFMVAPFYLVLFGLMLGDAGYGLIITIGCALFLKLGKPRGNMHNMVKMFMICGISTTFWGIMLGSFFGDIIPVFSETFLGNRVEFKPILFSPMDQPLIFLGLAFAIGYLHIMVGIILKGYMLIRDKQYLSALFDIGFWIIMLIGLPLLAVGGIIGDIGKWLSIASAVGLILTQGRSEKNIIKKFFSGVLSLYGITGYASDVLSYSRILGLGLSTGVIASVFNKLGTLMGPGIVSFILFIIVFLLGHTLNIALNVLGSYVHASRLQFVEFFSKFYESGGRAYDALSINTKYTDVVSEKINV